MLKEDDLPKKIKAKIKKRDKKRKPEMKICGKSVFQLKTILKKKKSK